MERRKVSSGVLAAIGYDATTASLEVEFHNGRLYRYFMVPASAHRALMAAPSIGTYFSTNIRDRYAYERVKRTRSDAKRSAPRT